MSQYDNPGEAWARISGDAITIDGLVAEVRKLREAADAAVGEAEHILAMVTGPWSEGQGLPVTLREAMVVRFGHLAKHARAILAALDDEETTS